MYEKYIVNPCVCVCVCVYVYYATSIINLEVPVFWLPPHVVCGNRPVVIINVISTYTCKYKIDFFFKIV